MLTLVLPILGLSQTAKRQPIYSLLNAYKIIFEALKSANMMKSRRLAKHITDASWYSFFVKFKYKVEEQGKYVVTLEQWYPNSKFCNGCKHKIEELSLSVRFGVAHQAAKQGLIEI